MHSMSFIVAHAQRKPESGLFFPSTEHLSSLLEAKKKTKPDSIDPEADHGGIFRLYGGGTLFLPPIFYEIGEYRYPPRACHERP